MMFDFSDVHAASKAEQIRAFSVEQAMEFHRDQIAVGVGARYADLISLSKMIEDYITHGDVTNSTTAAVEEGYTEGRFEVKEAVEEWFSDVDLDALFRTKGWARNLPKEG